MNRNQEKPKYSDKFFDSEYEYRFVTLPRSMTDKIIEIRLQGRFLSEEESRELGIIQSKGWVHYDYHIPEPHIILYKRPLGANSGTDKVKKELINKYFSVQEKKRFATALHAK